MKKKFISLALALSFVLALAVPALAAETVVIPDTGGVSISNVTSTSTDYAAKFHEQNNVTVQEWGNIKTYYASAPCDVINADFAAGTTVVESMNGATLTEPGTYLFGVGIWGDEEHATVAYGFYIVVGGSAPASTTPAPSTPTPSTPAPVTPAPVAPAPGNTAALKTTAGLVNAIPPSPVAGQDLAYTVQPGEILWSIAWNYYGSMSDATISKIYNANAEYFKRTKNVLEAGAVLTLPAKGLINPVTQGSLSNCAGMYLVKADDSLAAIAKVYYGDMNQWKKIYEANKDRVKMVGKSPMIYECQWLVIPE